MYEVSVGFRTARSARHDGHRSDKSPFVVDGDTSSVSKRRRAAAEGRRMSARKIACIRTVSVEKPKPVLVTFDRGVEIAVQPHNNRGESRRIAF